MKVKEKTMKIEDMKAGRELDALVAEKVMGWKKVKWLGDYDWRDKDGEQPYTVRAWNPSTDIAAAWQVVEKIQERQGRDRFIIYLSSYWGTNSWVYKCEFIMETVNKSVDGFADTAPLAICLAALRAVGAIAAEDEDYGGHA